MLISFSFLIWTSLPVSSNFTLDPQGHGESTTYPQGHKETRANPCWRIWVSLCAGHQSITGLTPNTYQQLFTLAFTPKGNFIFWSSQFTWSTGLGIEIHVSSWHVSSWQFQKANHFTNLLHNESLHENFSLFFLLFSFQHQSSVFPFPAYNLQTQVRWWLTTLGGGGWGGGAKHFL